MTFDEWYVQFQAELQQLLGYIPQGMDKECYREDYDDGDITPGERAIEEIEDAIR